MNINGFNGKAKVGDVWVDKYAQAGVAKDSAIVVQLEIAIAKMIDPIPGLKTNNIKTTITKLGIEEITKIAWKHLVPNLSSIIIIQTMYTIPAAIFFEAFLILLVVTDLPEPDSPTMANVSPLFKWKLTSRMALTSPA